jgi:MFS family permease
MSSGELPRTSGYRAYLLAVLLVILAFNYVDRYALGWVLESIKTDLHLSDSQLGFLGGIAFALFYSVMGIPIARWADRGNRVTIVSITAIVWSAMVALCGAATSFVQLLLIRIGVGVGEAGCIPPAHSLIADHFTRAERPRAVAIYMQGASVSVVIGYFLAGWLNELYGWRTMFVLLSVPGLLLGIVARVTLSEPRLKGRMSQATPRGVIPPAVSPTGQRSAKHPSLKEVCASLWANRSFRHLLWCYSLLSFFNYGVLNWQPAFFVRSFGMNTGELGTWFAVVYGVSTLLGIYGGGEWASRRAPNNEPLQLKAMAIANAIFNGVLWSLVYFMHTRYLAFALMGLANLGSTMIYGPLFATFQTLVSPRMRAMSIAIVYFFANLIGLGLGPVAVGALSDALRPLVGEESLRYALFALCPGYLWASWHLWRASRTVTRDLLAPSSEDDTGFSLEAERSIAENHSQRPSNATQ